MTQCETCAIKIFPSPIIIKNPPQNNNPVVCVFDYTDLGDFLFLQAFGFQDETLLLQKSECILKTPQVTWRTIYCFLWGVFRLVQPDILLTEKKLNNEAYTQLFKEFNIKYFQFFFKDSNLKEIMRYLNDANLILLRHTIHHVEVKRVDLNSIGVSHDK